MSRLLHTLEKIASLLTKYIGLIIICFSVLAFFWRDGFAWTTTYTSVFLGVAMFGMGLTIHMGDCLYQTERSDPWFYCSIYTYAGHCLASRNGISPSG